MLKRLLIIWLMVSTLGYGVVWAFDGHLSDVGAHQSSAQSDHSGDKHALDMDENHPACDHCCHASAHLVALRSCPGEGVFVPTYQHYTPRQKPLIFQSVSPPERPPKV